MGYTTEFNGHFTLDRTLKAAHALYLAQFSETRRMKRDETKTALRPDPLRTAVGLPVGPQGGYFVGEEGFAGQGIGFGGKIDDVLDYNSPPRGQPGLWCKWIPCMDKNGEYNRIAWNGGEKFYDYVPWLCYIIEHFLKPWGYTLNGEVEWFGEDRSDIGKIVVKDNVVTTKRGQVNFN